MIFTGFFYGWKFIRQYGNYLLGLEWFILATSASNFLAWSLLGGDNGSIMYSIAYFFDAFSRSVGVSLILVIGLMRVTHRYKPTLAVDIGVFALGIVSGLYLQQFHQVWQAPVQTARRVWSSRTRHARDVGTDSQVDDLGHHSRPRAGDAPEHDGGTIG